MRGERQELASTAVAPTQAGATAFGDLVKWRRNPLIPVCPLVVPGAPAYAPLMAGIAACDVPEGSLLAGFGGPEDYRDCFCREVPGTVSLPDYIERFYCSIAFRPERLVLGLMGRGASDEDARALARGETDRIAVWKVVERRDTRSGSGPEAQNQAEPIAQDRAEILLESAGTGTASWLSVEPLGDRTRLLFGSWVGKPERPVMLALYRLHRLYSRVLLGGC